ncbi:MAG: hypothetical protein R3257_00245 [bacterium]|nr:hypothetical protein [bacterium]
MSPLGPGGGALDGPAGLGVGQATGDEELSAGEQEDLGSGGSDGGGGVFQANPTMDEGDVGPIHDVPIHPPAIFGEAEILCKFGGDHVRMSLSGHVAHPEFEKGSSDYLDYEVGSGRTLRMVDRVKKQYMEIQVEAVAEGEGDFGEGQKNQFEVTFAVQYPFPDMPPRVQPLEFYLSPGEHQSTGYGEVQDCPSITPVLINKNLSVDKPATPYCAPKDWIKVNALQPFIKSDLDVDQAPPCNIQFEAIQNFDITLQ